MQQHKPTRQDEFNGAIVKVYYEVNLTQYSRGNSFLLCKPWQKPVVAVLLNEYNVPFKLAPSIQVITRPNPV